MSKVNCQLPDIQSKSKGFTLIEFLIYSVILSFIVGALTLTAVNIMRERARIDTMEAVTYNGKMIIESITSHVRQAESFSILEGGELSLEMSAAENNPTEFHLIDEAVAIKRGEGGFAPISSEMTAVSALEFADVSHFDAPAGTVRIKLTVGYSNPAGRREHDFSKTFYTTENIRR